MTVSSPPPTKSPSSPRSVAARVLRLVIGLCCVLLIVVLFLLRWPVEVHHWDQPAAVNYKSFDPYAVMVFEVSPVLSPWVRYEVWVVNNPHHGHMTEYGFHNAAEEPNYFNQCRTEWTPEGVTLIEPTGHKLFIPKDAFIGGR